MKKGSETRTRAWGSPLGLGLLLGGATFAYGYEAGCRKAEILAINDDGMFPSPDDWAASREHNIAFETQNGNYLHIIQMDAIHVSSATYKDALTRADVLPAADAYSEFDGW